MDHANETGQQDGKLMAINDWKQDGGAHMAPHNELEIKNGNVESNEKDKIRLRNTFKEYQKELT